MESETWSFKDKPTSAARIKREYAELLLRLLPEPCCIEEAVADSLVDAYRALTRTSLQEVRRCREADCTPATGCLSQKRRANASAAACRLVHLLLVALQLNQLEKGDGPFDELELVLQAERSVEALVEDIDS
jgi:hypothetical protein